MHMAAIRMLFSWLTEKGVLAMNPARVRGRLDHVQKLLNLTFDKRPRFAFSPRKFLGLDFPRRIHGQDTFFGSVATLEA
jgi:hypothetical protein